MRRNSLEAVGEPRENVPQILQEGKHFFHERREWPALS